MNKKIVLFSDGTGNSSGKAEKTNVWRLFQALEQNRCDVVAMYDDGVGTSVNKYLAILGGVFGWGLKRNVLDLYKFACRNYTPGDDLYGFGFSRGAFTIRVLVGFISREGLVTFRSEEELDRNAKMAYRHYRSKSFHSWSPFVFGMRLIRDALLWLKDWMKGNRTHAQLGADMVAKQRKDVGIRFLGLWDTVGAYGMPVEELKRGIHWLLWPMMFGDCKLSLKVRRACHALALDDERTTFHPLVWDEQAEAERVEQGLVEKGRITQVWFPGVHSNVGGGYPEDQLSLITLAWMMNQAIANDLPLDMQCVQRVNADKSPYARLYDSRAGMAAYYRYAPRRIPVPCHGNEEILPIVHASVILRMVHGSDDYAPITLPHRFWVLGPDGTLAAKEGFRQQLTLDATKKTLMAAASAVKPRAVLERERVDLEHAMAQLDKPAADAVELIRDTVWYRRVVYFFTLALTFLLIAYPYIRDQVQAVIRGALGVIPFLGKYLATVEGTGRGLITPVVDAVAGFIPSYLSRWSGAFVKDPIEFGLIVLAVAWCLFAGKMLHSRIEDRARLAWHATRRRDYLDWLLDSVRGRRNIALVALIVLLFLTILTSFGEDKITPLQLAGASLIAAALFVRRIVEIRKYARLDPDDPHALNRSFALRAARWMRCNPVLILAGRVMVRYVIPLVFVAGLVVAAGYLANRVLFDAASAAGAFCEGTPGAGAEEQRGETDGYTTAATCWPTGLTLEAGRRYRITLDTPGDWFDRTLRTDVDGFAIDRFRHVLGAPLRRWWGQNWFKPIARVGRLGNDEYVLEPITAAGEHTYCTQPERFGGSGFSGIDAAVQHDRVRAERENKRRQACAQCTREPAATVEPHGIASPIARASADALLACSPTPEGRRKLVADITPRTRGELFIYVNDAVWMLPGKSEIFYRNNSGTGSIRVELAPNRE